ncbi:MAG: hypothetical protein ACE5JL_01520 [Dehalococcoidia bacterium]
MADTALGICTVVHWWPMWKVRDNGIGELVKDLHYAYDGTEAVHVHYDMDVIGGAGPASVDIFGLMGEPLGMTDYEILKISLEIGKRELNGLSILCIPPSPIFYRLIVYTVMYMLAGRVAAKSGA